MKTVVCLTALTLAFTGPVYALQQPTPSKNDSRIRYFNYNPDQVFEIWTVPGADLEIQVSPEEQVSEGNIAVTDGDGFVRSNRGNFIYLKAKRCMVAKPVLITTVLPNGQLRPYRFQFETRSPYCQGADYTPQPQTSNLKPASLAAAAPGPQHTGMEKYVDEGGLNTTTDAMMAVVFKYPAEEATKRAALGRQREIERQRREAAMLLKQQTSWPYGNQFDGSWNFRYVAHGNLAVPPRQVRDNGYQTVFLFPQMQRVPALFRLQPGALRCNREHDDHNEGTENPSVHRSGSDGDTIIAQGTAQGWCLRDGNTVLELLNFAYSPAGATPATGTVSPYVKRVLKDDPEPEEAAAPKQEPMMIQPRNDQGAPADGH
jgi:type IV secretion system protein VirB9